LSGSFVKKEEEFPRAKVSAKQGYCS
jgi:hypothetical protein